jgi:Ca2+-binding EF-hand superfamily protein
MAYWSVKLAIAVAIFIFVMGQVQLHTTHQPHDKRTKEKDHYKGEEHNADFDHEAILGSHHEAENYDHRTPEESKKRLRVLCAKMDENKNGQIEKVELTKWIEKSLKNLDQEELHERFAEIDLNKDHFVSWEEYKSDAFGDNDAELDDDDKRVMKEDTHYFDAADQDKDKRLTKEEFAAFQNPEGHAHMWPAVLTATLDEKDKNKDGKLSLNEYLVGSEDAGGDFVDSEKTKFSDLDKNKDGQLDEAEMKDWLIPNIHKTAESETTHLFEVADANKDGVLSFDEIVNNHETFVGSEATNYGEHLDSLNHSEL